MNLPTAVYYRAATWTGYYRIPFVYFINCVGFNGKIRTHSMEIYTVATYEAFPQSEAIITGKQ